MIDHSKPLNEKEIHSLIEVQLKPYRESINPASAPYLTVEHFLWTIALVVSIMSTLLGYLWKKMNDNNVSINARVTLSNDRIHQRIDCSLSDIEKTEDKVRQEYSRKFEIVDDRLWYLTFRKKRRF